jgi:4-hydroxy-3-methylbut-2-en-1-yl diphosphate reductase
MQLIETKPPLTILLCAPRGFCAGVVRAIDVVEVALQKFGAPVYVRHEIVHNRFVVDRLKGMGAVFVAELDEIPDGPQPVVFSAHGVPRSVTAEAERRGLFFVDATCPLVTKVHREAEIHWKRGREVILIGHDGHPEVVGTMGRLPPGAIHLVGTVEDVQSLQPRNEQQLAFVTQTTLSVDDTTAIVAALEARFPSILGPHKQDICYATTNRQAAIKNIAPRCDAVIVVGSPNSSNSQRLREVAELAGCPISRLVPRVNQIDWSLFSDIKVLGLTAGASAPEFLVDEIMTAFKERYDVTVETVETIEENVSFPLPRALRDAAAA